MARRAISVVFLALWCASCSDGGSSPALPECAAELPLPEVVAVVEVTATPTADNPTCAVTLASANPVDVVAVAWQAALDEAGVAHVEQLVPGRQALMRMEGPVCGSILVFAAGTERVTDAVAPGQTPALASITPCK